MMHLHGHSADCACGCHDHHDSGDYLYHSHNGSQKSCDGHTHPEKAIPEEGCEGGSFSLQAYAHENAHVVSAQFCLQTREPERFMEQLSAQMRGLAEWTQMQGGFVGHIKCGVSAEQNWMISITDTELHRVPGTVQRMRVNLAAIVFGTDLEQQAAEVERIVHNLFHE